VRPLEPWRRAETSQPLGGNGSGTITVDAVIAFVRLIDLESRIGEDCEITIWVETLSGNRDRGELNRAVASDLGGLHVDGAAGNENNCSYGPAGVLLTPVLHRHEDRRPVTAKYARRAGLRRYPSESKIG